MTNSEKLIIVTGGAGFIGSGIIRELNNQGKTNILVVDDLGHDDKWKNLVGKKFYDIIGIDHLFDWLEEMGETIGGCIHLGANSSTVEKDADHLLDNNYRYTQMLATWCVEHDVRFVYASSAATYGDGLSGFSDDHSKLYDYRPLNMYGYSKHLFDLWALEHDLLDQIVGLKYFNLFGPNEWHKGRMMSAVVKFTDQIKEQGHVKLFASSEPNKFGDGDQVRDFLYVKDAAKMTIGFLENDAGGIFNIGSGTPNTWNRLAKATFNALDKPTNIEYIPMPEDLLGKYQNYTCADMQKSIEVLGQLTQPTELEDAVEDYVCKHLMTSTTW